MHVYQAAHFGGKAKMTEDHKAYVLFTPLNMVQSMWLASLVASGTLVTYDEVQDISGVKEEWVGVQSNYDRFPATARYNAKVKVPAGYLIDRRIRIFDDIKAVEKSFKAFVALSTALGNLTCHMISYREPSSITNLLRNKQPVIAVTEQGSIIHLQAESEFRRYNKPGNRYYGPWKM